MPVEAFVDTNVFVYAATDDEKGRAKRIRALELIGSVNIGLSAQVLQEFYVAVTRKVDQPLTPLEAMEWIEQMESLPCADIDPSLVKQGAWLAQRYQISYWDGAIVAAAQALEAPLIFTEDLNHGQKYEGIEVRNPFV
jgi:predicted nucleic acid-binding protein